MSKYTFSASSSGFLRSSAFFLRFLRAATQGGIQMGFDAEEAQMIAVQTAKGAASLILTNKEHPEVEIDRVTTPEGCTIEGFFV